MLSSPGPAFSRKRSRPPASHQQQGVRGQHAPGHYDARPLTSRADRAVSRTVALRRYNNLVKRRLLEQHGPPRGGTLVDLCCGRAGDLDKWRDVLGPDGRVLGIDISVTGIGEAERRRREHGANAPFCMFFRADAADALLWSWIRNRRTAPDPVAGRAAIGTVPGDVDAVTCHFALHYSWDTIQHATNIMANASARLRRGGHFVITTVNWDTLCARARAAATTTANNITFGNALYTVRIEDADTLALIRDPAAVAGFGVERRPPTYTFQLEDAVDNCIEYGVPAASLTLMAETVGLRLVSGPLPFTDIVPDVGNLSVNELAIVDLYAAWIFVRE